MLEDKAKMNSKILPDGIVINKNTKSNVFEEDRESLKSETDR